MSLGLLNPRDFLVPQAAYLGQQEPFSQLLPSPPQQRNGDKDIGCSRGPCECKHISRVLGGAKLSPCFS